MANTFHLEIVTPSGIKVDEQVESCVVRTTEGDLGILKGHADHMAAVSVGMVRVKSSGGTSRTAAACDGFVQVSHQGVKVVVTTFEWADEIDTERAQASKDRALKCLEDSSLDASERELAGYQLKKARMRLRIAQA